ncbi:MAG: cytochrome c biogenesis protein CcsA [Sphingobacteriales bacterium]|nr:cytochrome c biogenesis protein CcsA [Sphingobacteriales bacterium]
MQYIGERLLPGQLGHLFVILSLVASLVAAIAYFKSTQSDLPEDKESWKRLARIAFSLDIISVFAIFFLLIFLIQSHYFEYFYVYKNSSTELEPKYILSCLWSASEGSFLLWTLWHAVLGGVLMFKGKEWEAPVMTVISFAQFCLATMLLGIYFFGKKVGASPFALFRQQMPELPLFASDDYVTKIKDGNGLNPLLQNYWMVIHPPVLFLGFASTIVPFAYGIAGLWTKKFGEVMKAALPWALFSAAVLGLGIMMGAAWAYESLTFGGYWAWDPVENASLVPWLVLVCGIHTLLAYRSTGHSLRATHLFFILQFILILYSTFLTRSGILGDSSVHSFADLGMNIQLLLFVLVFLIPALILFAGRYKQIPNIVKEESISSREFWLFVGSLVLFLSAVYIISFTSLPVFNNVTDKKSALGEDQEYTYNRVMVLVTSILGLLTAITQYLKYKNTNRDFILKKIGVPTVISLIISVLISIFGGIHYDKYGAGYLAAIHVALFAAVYSVVANAMYIWVGMKGDIKKAGASVAHFGFGLVLVGILISSSKKEVISFNTSGIAVPFGEDSKENSKENLTLVRGQELSMLNYKVNYRKDTFFTGDPKRYFEINFQDKEKGEEFNLYPNAFINYKGNTGLMANPDSKHYWNKDIFTYITSLPDPEKNKDTANFHDKTVKIGEKIFFASGYMTVDTVTSAYERTRINTKAADSVVALKISVIGKDSSNHLAQPLLVYTKGNSVSIPDTVLSQDLSVRLNAITTDGINIGVKESDSLLQYVTLKAYVFPMINILWIGIIVMVIGFLMSMWRRFKNV